VVPNLIEAAGWVEQDERRKIRLAKVKEILKAWEDLFFITILEMEGQTYQVKRGAPPFLTDVWGLDRLKSFMSPTHLPPKSL
jgi:hypothetical protein